MTTRMQLIAVVLPSFGVDGGRFRTTGPDLRASRR
jgi:hypothetical protein